MIETVLRALQEIRLPYALYEMDIHGRVEEALKSKNIAYNHEAKLLKGCRIDYLAGSVGIEIKKGKPNRNRLLEQLERYLASDALSSIVLVSWHSVSVPALIGGKRVERVILSQLWGLSLP